MSWSETGISRLRFFIYDDDGEEEGQPHQKEKVEVDFIRKSRGTLGHEWDEEQR